MGGAIPVGSANGVERRRGQQCQPTNYGRLFWIIATNEQVQRWWMIDQLAPCKTWVVNYYQSFYMYIWYLLAVSSYLSARFADFALDCRWASRECILIVVWNNKLFAFIIYAVMGVLVHIYKAYLLAYVLYAEVHLHGYVHVSAALRAIRYLSL